jgi:hypothetical protein
LRGNKEGKIKKASVEVTFDNFFAWMNWYMELLDKIYNAKRVISKSEEKREIFEAFVLKIHATWEIFVEDLLVDCLNKDTTQYAEYMSIRRLRKHLPRNQCKAMVLGMGYLDFRDVSDIKGKANNILVSQHNPFALITNPALKKMNEFYCIRNYIAHYSATAKRSLWKIYKNTYKMKRFHEPGHFLMAWDRKMKQIRFDNYIIAFLDSAIEMAEFLGL